MRARVRQAVLGVGAVVGLLSLVLALAGIVCDAKVLVFRSGSMSPTIHTGALAVARYTPAGDLRVGDVVSVTDAGGTRITHRVTAVEHRGTRAVLTLKGDANTTPDPTAYDVRGADRVVASVDHLGYAASAAGSPVGLALLGAYGAFLASVLLRKRSPETEPPRGPGPARRRRGLARSVVRAGATALVAVLGVAVPLRLPMVPTLAAFTDTATTTGSTFGTATIAAPATFTCGTLGVLSVTFNWSAVAGATSYTLHYGSSGSQTVTTASTSATVVTAIAGGTAWVTTNRNFGSTTWTSGPSGTRSYTVAVVSLCA